MIVEILYCRPIYHPFPIVAWLIMLFEKMMPWKRTSYSHMAILIDNEVHDSTGTYGVQQTRLSNFVTRYQIVKKVKIKMPVSPMDMIEFFHRHKGKKYDRLQILGLAIKNIFTFVTFNKLGHDKQKVVCSEYIVMFFQELLSYQTKDTDNYGLNDASALVRYYGELHAG